jgi:hypothetical protein
MIAFIYYSKKCNVIWTDMRSMSSGDKRRSKGKV